MLHPFLVLLVLQDVGLPICKIFHRNAIRSALMCKWQLPLLIGII